MNIVFASDRIIDTITHSRIARKCEANREKIMIKQKNWDFKKEIRSKDIGFYFQSSIGDNMLTKDTFTNSKNFH